MDIHTFEDEMMLTRIFKSGNSLAIRIPKELAIAEVAQQVEIERVGNTLVIRPVAQESLADVTDILAMFSPEFMAEGREESPEQDRDWETFGPFSIQEERPEQ
ncbi:antitoxin [Methylococcus capsulatus]|nr:type II toxin-antitoxin system VapB family antitoxin [Methylococcus capsulatus]UQN12729.1 type II toxin-antitoxin system VapB family antitoxin [Methylococcus capsulatus]